MRTLLGIVRQVKKWQLHLISADGYHQHKDNEIEESLSSALLRDRDAEKAVAVTVLASSCLEKA